VRRAAVPGRTIEPRRGVAKSRPVSVVVQFESAPSVRDASDQILSMSRNPKKPDRPRNLNQLVKRTVDISTGEVEDESGGSGIAARQPGPAHDGREEGISVRRRGRLRVGQG
jgi:hypothetical protein